MPKIKISIAWVLLFALFAIGATVKQLIGPASSTNNAIVRWSGTGGYITKNSSVIIDDSGNITGVNSISISGGTANRTAIFNGSAALTYSTVGMSIPLDVNPTILPGSNFARQDSSENDYRLLYAEGESAMWQFALPENFNGNLKVKILFKMSSATSGNVIWAASIWAVSSGDSADLNTPSFDTSNTQTTAVPGTAGFMTASTVTCSNIDSAVAGDFVQIKISRNSSTATGDAAILGISISYDIQ